MRLSEVVAASRAVAETSGRLAKIAHLADLLKRTPPDELETVVAYPDRRAAAGPARDRMGAAVSGPRRPRGRCFVARDSRRRHLLRLASPQPAAPGRLRRGPGCFAISLGRATADEQDFLLRLLSGELRQGALEGVLLEAVARASGVTPARVRRATMLAGDIGVVARTAIVEGDEALSRFILQPFKPVQPMLADSAADVADALENLGEASFEHKLDGARIQAHKVGDEVRVFSRNLRDVTIAVPEVVTVVRAMPARELVLDGEAIVFRPDGTPQPFQITMRRFGRKLDSIG